MYARPFIIAVATTLNREAGPPPGFGPEVRVAVVIATMKASDNPVTTGDW
jgi:hypothetical protein